MPLDRSETKRIVDSNIERLMREFGIPHWRIEVSYEALTGARAVCITQDIGSYERAEFKFDPEQFDSEEQLIRTLEHELLHVVSYPMIQYGHTVERALPDSQPLRDMDNEVFRHLNESMIRNLERLVFGLRAVKGPRDP